MIPRIDQAVWRGAWLLILFEDAKALKQFCDQAKNIYIRVWWKDRCRVEGYANILIDRETIEDNRLMLDFVDLAENSGGDYTWPTKIEVEYSGQKAEYTIEMATRNEKKWRTWETWRKHLRLPLALSA